MLAPPWLRYSDRVRRRALGLVMVLAGCFGNPVEELTGSIGTTAMTADGSGSSSGTSSSGMTASTADDAQPTESSTMTQGADVSSDDGSSGSTTDGTGGTSSSETTGEPAETTTGEPPGDVCTELAPVCPCIANNCCAELQGCVQFPECDAVAQCVANGGSPKSCVGNDIPQGGDALATCAVISCGGQC